MKKSSVIWLAVIVAMVTAAISVSVTIIIKDDEFSDRLAGDEDSLSLAEFEAVQDYIDYYYLKDYDMKDVQHAGLKAMMSSLGDPYSVYYTPEEFDTFNQEAAGEYYGVGMLIATDEETELTRVEHIYTGSPAMEAGILVGDFIISIDGEDVTQKSLEEISDLSVGKEGTPITMGIRRGDETLSFDMVRRAIAMDMLSYKMLDDEIGYMKIYQFGGNVSVLFAEAMGFFEENDTKGVVIDLRDNPGGFFHIVVEMLDMLLPDGTIVYTEDKYGDQETSRSDAAAIDMPVTLIVNGNTASAAEIFAGAVQDYEYGEVVGTTSYGKGLVQVVLPIPDGGAVKITTSEYFTPNGRSINGNGIYPDYVVELPESYYENPTADADVQLQKAIEVMENAID